MNWNRSSRGKQTHRGTTVEKGAGATAAVTVEVFSRLSSTHALATYLLALCRGEGGGGGGKDGADGKRELHGDKEVGRSRRED
jgi:hypothetical protein